MNPKASTGTIICLKALGVLANLTFYYVLRKCLKTLMTLGHERGRNERVCGLLTPKSLIGLTATIFNNCWKLQTRTLESSARYSAPTPTYTEPQRDRREDGFNHSAIIYHKSRVAKMPNSAGINLPEKVAVEKISTSAHGRATGELNHSPAKPATIHNAVLEKSVTYN